jgi:hypothetical protein
MQAENCSMTKTTVLAQNVVENANFMKDSSSKISHLA